MSNKLVADLDYIQLDDISDNTEMSSLLSARNSRRVSDNSTPENSLQQSIDETVERNPCKRIGLSQVGTFIAFSHLTAPLQFVFCSKSNCSFLQYLFSSVFRCNIILKLKFHRRIGFNVNCLVEVNWFHSPFFIFCVAFFKLLFRLNYLKSLERNLCPYSSFLQTDIAGLSL